MKTLRNGLLLSLMVCMAIMTWMMMTPSEWNPKANRLWDPNRLLSKGQITKVSQLLAQSSIPTYVVVIRDFSTRSIGADWETKVSKIKPGDPAYFPAGTLLEQIHNKYLLGEKDPKGQSMVLLVTPIRGDPKKRWALSITEASGKGITPKVQGDAYLAFAWTINKQGDHGQAHPDKIVEGLQAALPILYQHIGK